MNVQLVQRPALDQAIHAISTNYRDQSTAAKDTARIVCLLAGACISAVAKYYSYPISKAAGETIFGDNDWGVGFGIAFQGFYSKAFFILEMWALGGILSSIIGPKTPQESRLGHKRNLCIRGALAVAVISAAIFARYPFSLPAAKYNPSNRLLAGGVSLAASLFIPMRSLMLSFEQILHFSHCSGSKEVKQAKASCISVINSAQANILEKSVQQQAFTQQQVELMDQDASTGASYLSQYTSAAAIYNPNKNIAKKVISVATAAFLGVVLEYAIADYTFKLTKELVIENDVIAGLFSTFAVLTTFHIYGKAMYSTNLRAINWISEKCCFSKKLSIAERVYPISTKVLKSIEIFSNVMALGTWFQIWNSFFKDDSRYFFVPVLLFTLFETLQTSSHDKINDVLLSQLMIKCFCSPTEIQAIQAHKNLDRIKLAIQKSSDLDFMEFYGQLPGNLQHRLFSHDQILKLNEMRILC